MGGPRDIDRHQRDVGELDAPIGAVQLPSSGVRFDRHGNPKALQSGQDEHPDEQPRPRRRRAVEEPQLAFATDAFQQAPGERAALAQCHKVLAGRQVTVAELRRKLVAAKLEPADIEQALDRCMQAGLLDDERYAAQFVDARVRRGHGAQRIRQDLARRGVDRAVVDHALACEADDEAFSAAAVDAARRKLARVDLDDAASRSKAMRWLLSRGFTSAQADHAVRTLRAERADIDSESGSVHGGDE